MYKRGATKIRSYADKAITVFMCGDVMTGRGIDQILPHPSNPRIYEQYVKSAVEYVLLAKSAGAKIPMQTDFSYIWGDALEVLEREAPDIRLINLETSITKSEDYWRGKGINYRMNPDNTPCLTVAKIDCCSLANNHILDWGYEGLIETLETLRKAGIKSVGAGLNIREAEAPAVFEVEGKGRVIVFSFGSETSGIPESWAATESKPGVNLLRNFSYETVAHIKDMVGDVKGKGDIVVASIHWGSNWGYWIPSSQVEFAHKLIDIAGVDAVHGHSSHHVKGIEVYRGKLILYGCGDFIDDYEGISGYEDFRDDLGLMYFSSFDPVEGNLISLRMIPTRIKHFRVNRASTEEALWLRDILNREGKRFGTSASLGEGNTLALKWSVD